ncbi:MAG: hypothetical protein ACOC2F_08705 [Bacteroidota bacterium]
MKQLFMLFSLCMVMSAYSQSVFVVQNQTNASVHISLDSALSHAVDGDYIYMPGGAFYVGNLVISKRINLIGAGHYPDSTTATGRTYLQGDIFFVNGADFSAVQGFYLTGDINFGVDCASGDVQNIFISRVSFNNIYMSNAASSTTNCGASDIYIKDCQIRDDVYGAYTQNVTIETSIISGKLLYFNSNANFNNNIFLFHGSYSTMARPLYYVSNCNFRNNIFYSPLYFSTASAGNIFYNNIFDAHNSSSGTFFNCLFDVSFTGLFEDVTNNSFSYSHDYHLTSTSVAKGAGLNGTDCGIYGGNEPFKEGAVPLNPHIQSVNIPFSTDSLGKLNVNIKVQAQDN